MKKWARNITLTGPCGRSLDCSMMLLKKISLERKASESPKSMVHSLPQLRNAHSLARTRKRPKVRVSKEKGFNADAPDQMMVRFEMAGSHARRFCNTQPLYHHTPSPAGGPVCTRSCAGSRGRCDS